MESEELSLYTKDGLKLYVTRSLIKNPKAVLCIVHGFSEHIGRYKEFMDRLASLKVACVGMDLRGHGRSEGLRGHAPGIALLMSDIEELMKSCRSEYTDTPMFLFGHSLGGGVVLRYIVHENVNELSGFISSSPWIKLAFDPPAWKIQAGKVASSFLPKLRLESNLNPEHLSRDKKTVEDYRNDPLINSKISARLYQIIEKSGEQLLSHAEDLKIPGLIYHGSDDKITSQIASELFFENHRNSVEYHHLNNVYHEPHQDLDKEKIFDIINSWIDRQIR